MTTTTLAWLGGIMAVLVVIGLFRGFTRPRASRRCELCGSMIKNTYYVLTAGDETKTICPTCNRGIERRKSREAVKRLFDGDDARR